MLSRMFRAAKLEPALYEEVERDRGALGQALVVVVLVALVAGLPGLVARDFPEFLAGVVRAPLVWAVFSLLAYLIGAKLLPESGTRASWGELLRTIGFAQAPGLIRVLQLIDNAVFSGLVEVVALVWTTIAVIVAIRAALDYASTGRAIAVGFLGGLAALLLAGAVAALVGVGGQAPVM